MAILRTSVAQAAEMIKKNLKKIKNIAHRKLSHLKTCDLTSNRNMAHSQYEFFFYCTKHENSKMFLVFWQKLFSAHLSDGTYEIISENENIYIPYAA